MTPIQTTKPATRYPFGFSMIELLIGIVIATLVMNLMYNFLAGTRLNFMFGTVSLANLTEARQAISYLRRDFSTACPFIAAATTEDYAFKEKVRSMVFDVVPGANYPSSRPIQAGTHALLFYRYKFDPGNQHIHPKIERVSYEFDSNLRTLQRNGDDGTQVFKGLEDVTFQFYCHDLASAVPILNVNILVHEMYDGKKVGQPLEISTSITSQFLNNTSRFLAFNARTFQQN